MAKNCQIRNPVTNSSGTRIPIEIPAESGLKLACNRGQQLYTMTQEFCFFFQIPTNSIEVYFTKFTQYYCSKNISIYPGKRLIALVTALNITKIIMVNSCRINVMFCCMSKRSCPSFYIDTSYKNGQCFSDIHEQRKSYKHIFLFRFKKYQN